ncbi:FHA domain-containing protein [Ketobacter sp. MCCC 1A13808]|uniref:ATPase, T2SS/T4P/T4SS family n=1 Tax=Ketobacter sp. MCCC 1A13808 TaxID=2602738 RepID=UPI0012EC9630|nr:ATPase, T2SS/T4P/T4SS family [Ketobacter sp. MCCC 1A13808]MVF12529.1 FHA domain-containing protein [Ketobacter sp. MCCC 1A13808]
MLVLEVFDQNNNKMLYEYSVGEYVLGKGDHCDVILGDHHVSRNHAAILVTKDSATLRDLDSTNGTWLNRQRIFEDRPLKSGDELVFGDLGVRILKVPSRASVFEDGEDRRASKSTIEQESEEFIALKRRVHSLILEYLDLRKRANLQQMDSEELREEAIKATRQIIRDHVKRIPDGISRDELQRQVVAEAVGLGALEPLVEDDSVTEIMVNGPDHIYVEKEGRLVLSESRFTSTQSLLAVIDRIVAPLGRRIDESSPMVDARLPDGSRVNAVIPPLALNGPTITIRKFAKKNLFMSDLIRFGSIEESMGLFLKSAVELKQNVVISGGTGSGKTTLLNILSNFISPDDRIITIEDAAELKLNQPHVISLESRPANAEGKGLVAIRDLVINALRMRPDRIVVGECRGGEALDMLQAMNTGHDGSLTTGHANSPSDFLSRLEVMVMMAGVDLPSRAIREQIASAVDILVQQSRMADGTRKITHIMEVTGFEDDKVQLETVFEYVRKGYDSKGKIRGYYRPTGYVPKFYRDSAEQGVNVDLGLFTAQGNDVESGIGIV